MENKIIAYSYYTQVDVLKLATGKMWIFYCHDKCVLSKARGEGIGHEVYMIGMYSTLTLISITNTKSFWS